MWIFDTPKDYKEMVEKISKSVFVISLIGLYILSCANEDFRLFLKHISFEAVYEIFGLELNLALFYIPLFMGILEHMFKCHDKISSLLKIRSNYDKYIIINGLAKKCGIPIVFKQLDRKKENKLMSEIFYKYASSTDPKIDSHSIILALNEWCWFWILLDTIVLLIAIGVPFLVLKWSCRNLLLVLICIVAIGLTMLLVMIQTIKYTEMEINAIWKDVSRQKEIKGCITKLMAES